MADPGGERRLAALVASAVVGYSRLMEADEKATLAALKGNHAATDPLGQKHGGRMSAPPGTGYWSSSRKSSFSGYSSDTLKIPGDHALFASLLEWFSLYSGLTAKFCRDQTRTDREAILSAVGASPRLRRSTRSSSQSGSISGTDESSSSVYGA